MPTTDPITLDSWLTELELPGMGKKGGLDKKARDGLDALKLTTVEDLLRHYPRRYEDRTTFDRFPAQDPGRALCLRGEVTDTQLRFMRGRRRFFEAKIEDPDGDALSGPITLRWFNMPWISKLIAVGQEMVLFGQPKEKGRRLIIDHPDYEIIDRRSGDLAEIHMNRIAPVYPLASGIQQRALRELVYRVLEEITDDDLPERLPEGSTSGEMFRARAIRAIHFPKTFEELEPARRYLALEEFTLLQLELLRRRQAYESPGGTPHCGPGGLLGNYLESLPFSPTGAQERTIAEIRADLDSDRPMSRLLQGDVGSGKTLVATAAMLLAVEAGFDAALMAPTQILAEQHYRNLQDGLGDLGITIRLRTGTKKVDSELPLFEMAAASEAGREKPMGAITVGTHALIHGDAADFDNPLGLVVIDEQHKFGVSQRQALIAQGTLPDVLVMTATPIPRTLTLAIYGDLDVSVIDEMPPGRGALVTGIREIAKTDQASQFVRDHLGQGRQAYIVYPLIEESEKVKSAAATVEFEKWEQRFDGFRCGLLHGKMDAGEKDRVMTEFRTGGVDVLVSTTVIEVGVDVANANLMLIFNAERFGLAQLHQLRGRIGRGAHKSYCILMVDPDPENPGAVERLKILEETRDGFRIAEEDLKQRGPGEVLGTQQSGLPDLKFAELLGDLALVKEARGIAEGMIADPVQQGWTAPSTL